MVLYPNWGDGSCRQYRAGNEQLCASGQKIKHNVVTTKLDDINDALGALGRGDIVGRAVSMFD